MAKRKSNKSKVKKFNVTQKHVAKSFSGPASLISTPSGKCPVDLEGTSDQEIFDWAKAVKESAKGNDQYTVNAIQYWVRDFYSPEHPEWKYVRTKVYELRDALGIKWLEPAKASPESIARFNRDRRISGLHD